MYTAVVRPAMTYGSTIWHTPKDLKGSNSIAGKLAVIQNRSLRTVAGAYRATPIAVLEAETHIPPITVHLNRLQRNARRRLEQGSRYIKKSCKTIGDKLRGTRGRRRAETLTPGVRKLKWAIPAMNPVKKTPTPTPPWRDLTEEQRASIEEAAAAIRTYIKSTRDLQDKEWQRI